MLNNTTSFWKSAWERHLESYLSSPPRTGIFVVFRHLNNSLESRLMLCQDNRIEFKKFLLHYYSDGYDL